MLKEENGAHYKLKPYKGRKLFFSPAWEETFLLAHPTKGTSSNHLCRSEIFKFSTKKNYVLLICPEPWHHSEQEGKGGQKKEGKEAHGDSNAPRRTEVSVQYQPRFPEPVLCARQHVECFTHTVSFKPHKSCSPYTHAGGSILNAKIQETEAWSTYITSSGLHSSGWQSYDANAGLSNTKAQVSLCPGCHSPTPLRIPGIYSFTRLSRRWLGNLPTIPSTSFKTMICDRWSVSKKNLGLPLQNNWQLSFSGKTFWKAKIAVLWSFLTQVCILTSS